MADAIQVEKKIKDMKKNVFITLLVIIFSAVPLLYLSIIYHSLPETIPTHFGLNGKPNGFGNKSVLITAESILCVLPIGLYFLLINIDRLDPKKTAKLSPLTFQKIGLAIVLLFIALNMIIIYASVQARFSNRLLLPVLGLFFVYLGNLMHSIKPNYFVGIRLP